MQSYHYNRKKKWGEFIKTAFYSFVLGRSLHIIFLWQHKFPEKLDKRVSDMGISQVGSGLLIKLLHPEELSFSLSWQVSLTNKKCVLNIYTAWKFPFCFCNSSFLYIYTVACLTIVQVGLSQPCLLTAGMLPEYLDSSILVPTF